MNHTKIHLTKIKWGVVSFMECSIHDPWTLQIFIKPTWHTISKRRTETQTPWEKNTRHLTIPIRIHVRYFFYGFHVGKHTNILPWMLNHLHRKSPGTRCGIRASHLALFAIGLLRPKRFSKSCRSLDDGTSVVSSDLDWNKKNPFGYPMVGEVWMFFFGLKLKEVWYKVISHFDFDKYMCIYII